MAKFISFLIYDKATDSYFVKIPSNIVRNNNWKTSDKIIVEETVIANESFYTKAISISNEDIDKEDLVYHLRAGDALLINNYNYFDSIKLNNLINSITYKKLYVVTNLEKKDLWTMDDLNKYKVKLLKKGDCGSYYKESNLINNTQMLESLKKLNSIIKILYDKNNNFKELIETYLD